MHRDICKAIYFSNRLEVVLIDGSTFIVDPHLIVKRLECGTEILKTKHDSGECMDIPLTSIVRVELRSEHFAIDADCFNYDFKKFELVYPRKADWFYQAEHL